MLCFPLLTFGAVCCSSWWCSYRLLEELVTWPPAWPPSAGIWQSRVLSQKQSPSKPLTSLQHHQLPTVLSTDCCYSLPLRSTDFVAGFHFYEANLLNKPHGNNIATHPKYVFLTGWLHIDSTSLCPFTNLCLKWYSTAYNAWKLSFMKLNFNQSKAVYSFVVCEALMYER